MKFVHRWLVLSISAAAPALAQQPIGLQWTTAHLTESP